MSETLDKPQVAAFPGLLGQIAALSKGKDRSVTAGHLDLGPGLWLSCDPAGQTVMGCRPDARGFRLSVEAGDSGAWACLGMRLPPETLGRGRYLGLLSETEAAALIAFKPSLRYHLEGGMQETALPEPVVLPSGRRTHLAHLPIDPALRARATGCELNLFFQTGRIDALVLKLEPLLIA